jgi:hypothetical protein
MPPTKRRQSNDMLYTLIVLIGLCIVAVTVAVIFYIRAEEARTQGAELQQTLNNVANAEELRTLGTIVGTKAAGQSQLGTMIEHLDRMVQLVKGSPVANTSAEVKVSDTVKSVQPLLAKVQDYITLPVVEPNTADANAVAAAPADANAPVDANAPKTAAAEPNAPTTAAADANAPAPAPVAADAGASRRAVIDPNRVALTGVIKELLMALQHTIDQKDALQKQLVDLRNRYDGAVADMQKTKETLNTQVGEYRQQVEQISTDYNSLKALMQRNSDEQIKLLLDRAEKSEGNAKQLNADLLKTQAELNVAQNRLQDALTAVGKIKPTPDQEAVAYKPDGKVILVDDAAGVIRINLGSDDRVYQGLTFSVYDKGSGIPRDGKPKAEVEVFAVDQKVCAARITSTDRRNPVHTDDLIANLIWDSGKENRFVIAGDFDLDGNGTQDYDAATKIEALIRKWGGTVDQDVSAKTDYVILGTEPKVPTQPTLETQTADPTLTDKYNAARQRLERYEHIRQQAQSLWVPIFSYDRFLNFTGYASQIGKPGAF